MSEPLPHLPPPNSLPQKSSKLFILLWRHQTQTTHVFLNTLRNFLRNISTLPRGGRVDKLGKSAPILQLPLLLTVLSLHKIVIVWSAQEYW